jgi:hypothetical protein
MRKHRWDDWGEWQARAEGEGLAGGGEAEAKGGMVSQVFDSTLAKSMRCFDKGDKAGAYEVLSREPALNARPVSAKTIREGLVLSQKLLLRALCTRDEARRNGILSPKP